MPWVILIVNQDSIMTALICTRQLVPAAAKLVKCLSGQPAASRFIAKNVSGKMKALTHAGQKVGHLAALIRETDRCMTRFAQIAVIAAKFLSGQVRGEMFSAHAVLRIKETQDHKDQSAEILTNLDSTATIAGAGLAMRQTTKPNLKHSMPKWIRY